MATANMVAAGILAFALPFTVGVQSNQAAEIAGADDTDRATKKQLKEAGQDMIPAENLKKAEPRSTPSAQPVSQSAPTAPATQQKMAEPKMEPKATPEKIIKPGEKPVAKPTDVTAVLPGVYLRLDVGYGITLSPDGSTTAGAMTKEDVGNFGVFGGGIGYRFNKNFRADATLDYRPDADVSATNTAGTGLTSEVNGMAIMINAYYDIGNFSGFTPYVGAGIGYARLETSDQTGVTANGDISNNLAWAAMVGTAIDVGMGKDTVADLGYRVIGLGEFKQQGGTEYDDLIVHEIRAGLRHYF